MIDVITIGSALQDVFLEVSKGKKITSSYDSARQQLLAFGLDDKIPVEKMHRHIGGGAINNAVVFSRLGLKVFPCTQVGNDSWGEGVISQLKEWGIDTSLVHRHDNLPTGLSVLLHDTGEDEHLSFNFKGASDNLGIGREGIPGSKWLHVSALTGDYWRDDIEAISSLAKDHSVAWNPGVLQRKAISELDSMLQNTDILLVNKNEAEEITKTKKQETTRDMRSLLIILHEMGPGLVVITEGRNGANVYDGTTWFKAPIVEFDVKDTTGTGDTFGATFVSGLIMQKDLQNALRMAMINSGAVTREWGAQQGLMKPSEIDSYLQNVEISEL